MLMSYQVISRKYRPQRFDEVIGQSHVSLTLQNAIKTNRISHAYLFAGSRGIGKTSTARILAKSLNCLNPHEIDPCNTCQNCIEITTGRSIDVLEIDGASNRGIDQIRDLRENVKYPPANSRYRIFIIDEVHMLTKEAFNALLKTLEEPPPHVVFIFATTEPLKIPATILSRCQRYDFHRIPLAEITRHLAMIAQKEGVTIADDILLLIAKKSEGAMRDAESLLDQLIAFSGKAVKLEDAQKILSLIDFELYILLGSEILNNNKSMLLQLAGKIIDEGINLAEFLSGLAEHFRNVLIANTTGSADMLDLPNNIKERYIEESKRWQTGDLLRLLKMISQAQVDLKTSLNQRLLLEFTLLRMGAMNQTVTVEKILDSLSRGGSDSKYQQQSYMVQENLDLFQQSQAPEPQPVQIKNNEAEIKPVEISPESTPQESPKAEVLSDNQSDNLQDKWETIIQKVADSSPSLASFLKDSKPGKIKQNMLEILFRNSAISHLGTIKARANIIEAAIQEITGKPFNVKCVEEKSDQLELQKKGVFDTMSQKIKDMFDGEIIPT
jgi:DNA polymerase-3 subunit gamma/tau